MSPERFCLKKESLQENGYKNLKDWMYTRNNVYITAGKMKYCTSMDKDSKWENPYSSWEFGEQKSLELYEEYIRSKEFLMRSIPFLAGKKLGCWCLKTYKFCHATVLIKLFDEIVGNKGVKRVYNDGVQKLPSIKEVKEEMDEEDKMEALYAEGKEEAFDEGVKEDALDAEGKEAIDVEGKEMKNKAKKSGDKKKRK